MPGMDQLMAVCQDLQARVAALEEAMSPSADTAVAELTAQVTAMSAELAKFRAEPAGASATALTDGRSPAPTVSDAAQRLRELRRA